MLYLWGKERVKKLSVKNLKKQYGSYEAVKGISFELGEGECLGILGQNIETNRRKSKSCLGIVGQEDMLDMTLNVYDNLFAHGLCYGISSVELRKRIDSLLDFVQLSKHAQKMVNQLSGGMRRRLVLARALINRPDIIILDEPTVGLDIQSRNIIWDKLLELKELGVSIIITSHYMNEIEYLTDRVLMLHQGTIKEEGTVEDLLIKYDADNLETLFLGLTGTEKEDLHV
ncbi:TPA: ABC transporter ATP-binding protein [Streptococcus pneumoniae]|nr:ABC transporter ATP-binding protein [Streptococcus pneumoniae]MDG9295982.1 ABC transporter ATP-binding protein [Streptococcus pneumoniae]MDG9399475.1 ABC transporter ATP-binding protein [Streptococcus pneumoniae]HET4458402.1 ABC transporter ATP-binding protein [Streptococcus pneumoniae]HET4554971.1 ABC transporter ATP-binding protein [Streptococcus pneumoniae]